LEAPQRAALLLNYKEARFARRTQSTGQRPRSPPCPIASPGPDSADWAAAPSRPPPAARGKPRVLLPPAVPLPSLRRRAPQGPLAVNERKEGGGRAGGSSPGPRKAPGALSAPQASESPPRSRAGRSTRTCRAPGHASRRRPPKEGPGRPGGNPISPRAVPAANQRRAAAGRAEAGEGSGHRVEVSFCAPLSGLAQPVRRRRRSAERCCACSRDSSAPPLRRFTAAAVQSCESKVVVPSGWKFVCMSRARSADSCSLTDSCHLTVQHISARGVFPCYQCFCSQKKSPNTAIWGLLGQKLTPSQPSAVLNCYGK